jgi:uncharacterized membrane protein
MSSTQGVTAGGTQSRHRLVRWFVPRPRPTPINPAVLKHEQERAEDVQNRISDQITRFAGSMTFVYIHILWFGLWIGLGVEKYPFGLLTMIVSLEAIFLSTFVMISQNRADAKRQVIADDEWTMVQDEDRQNDELLDISKQILHLTQELRAYADGVKGAAEQYRQRNDELLSLSKQALEVSNEVKSHLSADGSAEAK